ncbi:hypothetical protein PCE1_003390 [Barthelona sp. PCE]
MLNLIDKIIFFGYLFALGIAAFIVGRRQKNAADYYVGSRKISFLFISISILATQTSVNSILGIPSYVKKHSIAWLMYEMALPLSVIVGCWLLIPVFRNLNVTSIYSYIEVRFSAKAKLLMSGIFLISRSVATGCGTYAAAEVISIITEFSIPVSIIILGCSTITLDLIGGMAFLVKSDTLQMIVLIAGVVICGVHGVSMTPGGLSGTFKEFPKEKLHALDFGSGFGTSDGFHFWSMLFGCFILYISYYTCDQSQTQRMLSSKSTSDSRKSLFINGFVRFIMTAGYCFLGVIMYGVYVTNEKFKDLVDNSDMQDGIVPIFINNFIATGQRGIILAGMVAASLTSLDAALQAVSACTMTDFFGIQDETAKIEAEINDNDITQPLNAASDDKLNDHEIGESDESARKGKRNLLLSRLCTLTWGIIICCFALLFQHSAQTVVEGVNAVGSVFYGIVLSPFLLGILFQFVEATGVIWGITIGTILNCCIALLPMFVDFFSFLKMDWAWWNVTGFVFTSVVTLIVSSMCPQKKNIESYTIKNEKLMEPSSKWNIAYGTLFLYFCFILFILFRLTAI